MKDYQHEPRFYDLELGCFDELAARRGDDPGEVVIRTIWGRLVWLDDERFAHDPSCAKLALFIVEDGSLRLFDLESEAIWTVDTAGLKQCLSGEQLDEVRIALTQMGHPQPSHEPFVEDELPNAAAQPTTERRTMSTSDQNGPQSRPPSRSAANEHAHGLSEHDNAARRIVEGYVEANRKPAYVRKATLVAARVDPIGGSQYEVSCELALGDGSRIPITIDVDTATTLGRILIAQAALAWKASDNEIDAHMRRYEQPARASEEADDDAPF